MLVTIGYILLCVLMFSLAIAIHEFGHFIVALKLGLKVERFSIGFGPAIWKKTWRGVEYRISCIPLGGYVSIPDVDPEGTKKLEGGSAKDSMDLPKEKIPAWKELLVAVAGPAMNIVLAVVLALILACVPSAKFGQTTTLISDFAPGSAGKAAGLQQGDKVIEVGGHPVSTWTEMQTEVQLTDGRPTEFKVLRPKALRRTVELALTPAVDDDGALTIGASAKGFLREAVIEDFWPSSVAETAGLQVGDRIVSLDGVDVWSSEEVYKHIYEAPTGSVFHVGIRRGEETLAIDVPTVEAKEEVSEGIWRSDWYLQVCCPTNAAAPYVAKVEPEGVAAKAGLKAYDRVVSVDGHAVYAWREVEEFLKARVGQETTVVVERTIPDEEREYEEVTLVIAPERDPELGVLMIGAINVSDGPKTAPWMTSRNPFKQLAWDAGAIFRTLKALVTPKEAKATGKAIGGPVMIAEGIYRSTRSSFTDGLGFLRFLNTNLAVMNLLPIPVLDGGLILFSLIAMLFRRRIPEKVISSLSTVFMYLLLAAMAFLIYRDSVRSWKIHHVENPAEKVECVVPKDVYAI